KQILKGGVEMKKPTILVIEDFQGVRKTIEYVLENDYEIIEAETAAQGLEMIKNDKPDMVIIDHKIPGGMSGLDVVQLLKRKHNPIPVIMMSAFDIEDKARQSGVKAFLSKPCNVFDLKEIIKKYLVKKKEI
ncbi:response regulator, partial [Candidatus Margulisiibacteriota bacterium]